MFQTIQSGTQLEQQSLAHPHAPRVSRCAGRDCSFHRLEDIFKRHIHVGKPPHRVTGNLDFSSL